MTNSEFNQYMELREAGFIVDANPTAQGYKDLFKTIHTDLKKFREAGYASR